MASIVTLISFLALRRPPCLQGDEQFVSGRVLEMAERILGNLQKGIVDSTISSAAELENGSSYFTAYQALPYSNHPALPNYQSTNAPFEYDGMI